MPDAENQPAVGGARRRVYVFNGGFLTQKRMRRILSLSGYDVCLGLPGKGDLVGVWGQSPTAWRGERVAARRGCGVLRVEDAFLRSVKPGRDGAPPLGLMLDETGAHFDGRGPSDLETLLAMHPLDDAGLLTRVRDGIARLKAGHLSKYTAFDPGTPGPSPGYVLVIDQTAGDASVRASGADAGTFRALLATARAEHPGARVVVKTHPATLAGHRAGHFTPADLTGVAVCDWTVSPWRLLEGAAAVYVLSSQLGFEAILAGHRPVVFGQPFYAGWGLTDDRNPPSRRGRALTAEQVFAAAMILQPRWYDPFGDRLCAFETAVDIFAAQTRAFQEDADGWVATGMRLWKRGPLQAFFGAEKRVIFADPPRNIDTRRLMVWAGKTTPALNALGAARVEDGFLRSRGLGADLIPPLSLCLDDLGIYYDPSRESRLERLISAAMTLPQYERARAARLVAMLTKAGITKYNLGGAALPDLPKGYRILVPGQVEDDASILLGAGDVRTNQDLLRAVRAANPDAVILFKPHPDVEAGLRSGAVPDATTLADVVLTRTDPVAALSAVDAVWTMTSSLGFEALLRGVPVTCLGRPFYAGWGLTTDLGAPLPRRTARPDLTALAHACLIAYPRYFDPVTGGPCPVEVVVDRLAKGTLPHPGPLNRLVAKLQGAVASYAHLWR